MANVSLEQLNGCCGVQELSGASEDVPAEVLVSLDERHEDCSGESITTRNIVFTDAAQRRKLRASGWAFTEFIQKNRLGSVLGPSFGGRNPNTRNNVHVWVWTPNVKAVWKWLDKEFERREKEDDEDSGH